MNFTDKILHHEDIREEPFGGFISRLYREFRTPLPRIDEQGFPLINSELPARIDNGRWMVDCQNRDIETGEKLCNASIVTSESVEWAICPACGSPENDRRAYAVLYPKDKAEVERLLLLRPVNQLRNAGEDGKPIGGPRFFSPFDVIVEPGGEYIFRTEPAQTVDDLREENERLGFGV